MRNMENWWRFSSPIQLAHVNSFEWGSEAWPKAPLSPGQCGRRQSSSQASLCLPYMWWGGHWNYPLTFLPEQVVKLTLAWPHTSGMTSLVKSPSDTTQKQRVCKEGSSVMDVHSSTGNDWTKVESSKCFFITVCNLQMGQLGSILCLEQCSWHPVRRTKSIRLAFDQMGSMEIPGGVLPWFGYCILGLILGLLVGTDLGLIIWSTEWECSVEER